MVNALAHEKSPYLLQHADNPVDWMPWGEAAFAKARTEQKPIFLSIGYATCHWCHVMAHESFEHEDVAAILNASFVSIKVDREERPDVDKVYMNYVQAMTGHGGWPLSAWLTPELKPFFGGTYFPLEDRGGRAGFVSILRAIAKGWAEERDKLLAEGDRVITALREHLGSKGEGSERKASDVAAETTAAALLDTGSVAFEKCFQYFYEAFDPNHGGFGGAPKFPRASNLSFLFRAAALQGLESEAGREAVKLATTTLQAMARGGIHDHVGGGYHRYSVDERWFVPHFEKMLYDQAQIAVNALEAKQATGDERYAWIARDIFDYVLRDLAHPDGGFYSAEDADSVPREAAMSGEWASDGEKNGRHAVEGAFYVWTQAELAEVLGADAPMFAAHYGVAENGNVPAELDPQGELRGKNVLMQRQSIVTTARAYQLDIVEANDRLLASLEKLRAARVKRPRPMRDDKIITAWNGLMISALAKGAQVLREVERTEKENENEERERLLRAAVTAAEFLQRELYDAGRGVLYRNWRDGRGRSEGFAEDYAFLVQGLLDLYEASFDERWLRWAMRLQRTMDETFWDDADGGYFNSRASDTSIVLRLKEDYDGAEPTASSVAAMNLLRFAGMVGHGEASAASAEKARRCILAFRGQWERAAHALPQMLCALELALDAPRHVVIAGDPASEEFQTLAAVVHEKLGPRRLLMAAGGETLSQHAPWIAAMRPIEGRPTAYVCEEFSCQAPVTGAEELRRLLWLKGASQ